MRDSSCPYTASPDIYCIGVAEILQLAVHSLCVAYMVDAVVVSSTSEALFGDLLGWSHSYNMIEAPPSMTGAPT
jgi:hypothetical protein